ncbi:MAG: DEAD/DEAH box helicase [Acidimicrobiia bacterium]|nr:DEAD/DEAH box helicase [Acidimicrobiia bacterium]
MTALNRFSKPTRTWFEDSFPAPTDAQIGGWDAIASGEHTLIHAPTGSGKTLAAFLWMIDRLLHEPPPVRAERCRVLYISPQKALAHDIDRNLRAPLLGTRHAAERLGLDSLPELTTFLRTGDTPQSERQRMLRTPPDILITTPESLYLMLSSQARETLRSVRWVIVDEIHAIADSKRGSHLAISLERLGEIANEPQRIGLSATQRPLDTIAQLLGGGQPTPDGWDPRPVEIVDAAVERAMEVELVVPVEDMAEPAPPNPMDPDDQPPVRSIWPAVHPRILELIRSHRSTIVFANSRRLAERLSGDLNELAGEPITRAHHGSVSRRQRVEIEEKLKRGELAAVVATSSLELGIDMGAVDLVIQVEAPTSVASGLQRVGRAGHQVGEVSVAKIFPKHRGDLLVSTVVANLMEKGAIEATRPPLRPLDVLAQHLVSAVVMDDRGVDGLYDLIRGAAPYSELSRPVFEATLDMLAGRYPSDLFSELRPRLVWDRVDGTLTARPGSRQLVVTNPGTIPDRGLYRVVLPDGSRVGELDEEMVYESRQGDLFVLGASTWRVSEITTDRVVVTPAPGEPGAKMPFWHGDIRGRPLETGRALGRFTREIASLDQDDALATLHDDHHLDEKAAKNLIAYLEEERSVTGTLPSDETLVVERFRDEIGDWRIVVLSPLGAQVHAPWAMALTSRLRDHYGPDVDVIWSDDGIALRFPESDNVPGADELALDPDEVEDLLLDQLGDTALFAARFREAAGRSLLLPRRRPQSRTPLWLQRRRAAGLMSVAKQFGTFPIVLEVYREILSDDFDLDALKEVLTAIRSRKLRLAEIEVDKPSPFASSLLFAFVAAYLYEADTPLAERRAAALTLDRELLAELLGDTELRELLSTNAIADLEAELQRLTPERLVRSVDGVADLLRDLGPLTMADIDVRVDGHDVENALEDLEAARRVMRVMMNGSERWMAVEDAARLRDALGVQPPIGVPSIFLEPVPDPLGDVMGRYARTHGPFTTTQATAALGLPDGVVRDVLTRLETEGRVRHGSFHPGVSEPEWVDSEVLRRIKRRSLAELRGEIEPVDPATLGSFLPNWQRVTDTPPRSSAQLIETVRRLQAVPLPASELETSVLSARIDDAPALLDQAMIAGEVVWVGRGTLGRSNGKLALYLRDDFPSLSLPVGETPDGQLHDNLRDHLTTRGASFFGSLYESAGGGDPDEVLDALWDLVWAGVVTNDTLAPVRALTSRRRARRGRGARTLSSSFPAHASGRWSLVSDLMLREPSLTESAMAWAEQILERHGVVTRDTVAAEDYPGGFTALYPVLNTLEETGRVRRGYFVEGQGGAQFALPGAVDRIRSAGSDSTVVLLAATDPANPYGAALPWPEVDTGRLARSAGSYVILSDGALVGYVERRGKSVRILDAQDDGTLAGIAAALRRLAAINGRLTVETINDGPVRSAPLGTHLTDQAFVVTTKGLRSSG